MHQKNEATTIDKLKIKKGSIHPKRKKQKKSQTADYEKSQNDHIHHKKEENEVKND
jgi:hypothetical protein